MRYIFIMLMLIAAFIMMPFSAVEAQKAKTIDELAKQFDSTQCQTCHEEIYAQWEKSHHARPFLGVNGGMQLIPVVKASAFKIKDPKEATLKTFPCFKCHLPQAVTHAEDSVAVELAGALFAFSDEKATDDTKKAAKAIVAKLQITCLVCHNEKAITHRLVEGQPEKGVIYGTKNDDTHPEMKVKKSVIMAQPIFCGQCHGTGPNFEFDYPVQCATLYGSYQHNYLSNGGFKSCQECHMTKVNDVSDHLFGLNFDDKPRTADFLSKNIHLDVQTLGYQWLRKAGDLRPMVVVNTKITHDAGHRVPDGWPSHNRVVMEVTAKTLDGKEIFKTEKNYHTQATNCLNEKMVYGSQNKTSYVRDTSLQPYASKDETIEIPLPEGIRTVDVTVELNYEIQVPDNKVLIHKVTRRVTLDR